MEFDGIVYSQVPTECSFFWDQSKYQFHALSLNEIEFL